MTVGSIGGSVTVFSPEDEEHEISLSLIFWCLELEHLVSLLWDSNQTQRLPLAIEVAILQPTHVPIQSFSQERN